MLLLAALAASPSVAAGGSVDGVWQTEPRSNGAFLTVRIGPCNGRGDERCGTITGAHAGARPDVVGEKILRGLKREGPGRWSGGEIIHPRRGTVYSSSVEVSEGSLLVEGCALSGLLCGAQTWTRAR